MAINGIVQPKIIDVDESLRLRAYDGSYLTALSWYQDPVVYYNSEGITDPGKIPDENWVKGMYDYFSGSGKAEMYFIEVKENGTFIPIGDAAVQEQNPPIVIGVAKYRGIGIGKKVVAAIIARAREIGFKKLYNTVIYEYNAASQKLYESLGFVCVEVRGKERIYELALD